MVVVLLAENCVPASLHPVLRHQIFPEPPSTPTPRLRQQISLAHPLSARTVAGTVKDGAVARPGFVGWTKRITRPLSRNVDCTAWCSCSLPNPSQTHPTAICGFVRSFSL